MSSFALSWKQAQVEKEILRRRELKEDRSVLIQNGKFTPCLNVALKQIFSLYKNKVANGLTQTEASRLWYQCGLRLSSLNLILDDTTRKSRIIYFEDFLRLLERILIDDEQHYSIELFEDKDSNDDFQVRF